LSVSETVSVSDSVSITQTFPMTDDINYLEKMLYRIMHFGDEDGPTPEQRPHLEQAYRGVKSAISALEALLPE
jgi:hypothetical protein